MTLKPVRRCSPAATHFCLPFNRLVHWDLHRLRLVASGSPKCAAKMLLLECAYCCMMRVRSNGLACSINCLIVLCEHTAEAKGD